MMDEAKVLENRRRGVLCIVRLNFGKNIFFVITFVKIFERKKNICLIKYIVSNFMI